MRARRERKVVHDKYQKNLIDNIIVKISICSQVKNRRNQFEKTILYNLRSLKKDNDLEWIIVDMGSDDGIEGLIRENMQEGLQYYRVIDEIPYSIPIAKNVSARLSSGGYVFNLDIDNFICDIGTQIRSLGHESVFCDVWFKGVFGRIGCRKDIFEKVGGYDESFLPAAHHEIDFMNRCRMVGCTFHDARPCFMAIKNEKIDTIKNMASDLSWDEMNQINQMKTAENTASGVNNPNARHAKGR